MGKNELNPADAFRKKERKKELQKLKKDRAVVKEVKDLLNDPTKITAEIERVQKESDANKLDKTLKDRIKELKMMLSVALKKQEIRENVEKLKGKFNQTISTANNGDEEDIIEPPSQPIIVRLPHESIYYHPIYNPLGVPPPGQLPAYKPSSSSNCSGSSGFHGVPPPPPRPGFPPSALGHSQNLVGPPPPLLPNPSGNVAYGGINGIPLPPPRPFPTAGSSGMIIPPPPPPRGFPSSGSSRAGPSHGPSQKGRSGRGLGYVDPLDPSGAGYTARFENPHLKAKREREQREQEERALEERLEQQKAYYQQLHQSQTLGQSSAIAQSVDTSLDVSEDSFRVEMDLIPVIPTASATVASATSSAGASLHPPTAALTDVEQFFRKPEQVMAVDNVPLSDKESAASASTVVAGTASSTTSISLPFMIPASTISLEEIMRRRRISTAASEADIAGPAAPPVSLQQGSAVGHGDEDAVAAMPAAAAPAVKSSSSGLDALMMAYGDDSDDEEECPTAYAPLSSILASGHQPTTPSPDLQEDFNGGAVRASLGQDATGAIPPSTAVVAPITSKPRVVKADAALTAFVPTALRTKRAAASSAQASGDFLRMHGGASASTSSRLPGPISTARLVAPAAVAQLSTAVPPHSASSLSSKSLSANFDEADPLNEFLSEINQI